MLDRPRVEVSFQGAYEGRLVFLPHVDRATDTSGQVLELRECLELHLYEPDYDEDDQPNFLIGDGVVERNQTGHSPTKPWVVRLDARGVRHAADELPPDQRGG